MRYFNKNIVLSTFVMLMSAFAGDNKAVKEIQPPVNVTDLDPKYKVLADLVLKARKDSGVAFKIEQMFIKNSKGERQYTFTDPNVLNIVFHDFSCTNSSDVLYTLLAPELAEELAVNTEKTMQSLFLVQAGRINDKVPMFRKIIQCFQAKKPSVYAQLNSALSESWGEAPVPADAGEVAQKRLALLKKITQITGEQRVSLDKMIFEDPFTHKTWQLDEKQKEKFMKIITDFESDLNRFIPTEPRDVSLRSNSAGASNAKTGHVK